MKYKNIFTLAILFALVTSCKEVKVPETVDISIDDLPTSLTIHTEAQMELIDASDPIAVVD